MQLHIARGEKKDRGADYLFSLADAERMTDLGWVNCFGDALAAPR
jgi:hypothetical protein